MTEVKHRMKREALVRLIEWLQGSDDEHWNMGDTLAVRSDTETWDMIEHGEDLDRIPLCHTAGCLGGHCVLLQNVDKQMMIPLSIVGDNILGNAAEFLGIQSSDDFLTLKDMLFTPSLSYSEVTRQVAIDVLEHIRDKGVLHWGRFVKVNNRDFGLGLADPLPVHLY